MLLEVLGPIVVQRNENRHLCSRKAWCCIFQVSILTQKQKRSTQIMYLPRKELRSFIQQCKFHEKKDHFRLHHETFKIDKLAILYKLHFHYFPFFQVIHLLAPDLCNPNKTIVAGPSKLCLGQNPQCHVWSITTGVLLAKLHNRFGMPRPPFLTPACPRHPPEPLGQQQRNSKALLRRIILIPNYVGLCRSIPIMTQGFTPCHRLSKTFHAPHLI